MATKVINILHKNLAHCFVEIINGAEVFSQNIIDNEDRDMFETIITEIIDIKERNSVLLHENKAPLTIFSSVDNHSEETIIDKLLKKFPKYSLKYKNNLLLLSLLIEKYKALIGHDEVIIGTRANKRLTIHENKDFIRNAQIFLYMEDVNLDKSVILFTTEDLLTIDKRIKLFETIDQYFTAINIEQLLYFIWAIDTGILLNKKQYLVFSNKERNKLSRSKSFIKLKLVSKGLVIHNPYEFKSIPSLLPLDWKYENEYQQFDDITNILSEYNAREDDILNKYLKIYQVIENFMFKSPVCSLQRSSDSKLLTIRDFRNIYKGIDKEELKTLTDFIRLIFDNENSVGTTKFKNHIWNLFEQFKINHSASIPKTNFILKKIGINKAIENVKMGDLFDFYSILIYKTRNSIVHNKDTEYHLNISRVPNEIISILTDFLLPTLEQIIFKLVVSKRDLVTYPHKSINMWT